MLHYYVPFKCVIMKYSSTYILVFFVLKKYFLYALNTLNKEMYTIFHLYNITHLPSRITFKVLILNVPNFMDQNNRNSWEISMADYI